MASDAHLEFFELVYCSYLRNLDSDRSTAIVIEVLLVAVSVGLNCAVSVMSSAGNISLTSQLIVRFLHCHTQLFEMLQFSGTISN